MEGHSYPFATKINYIRNLWLYCRNVLIFVHILFLQEYWILTNRLSQCLGAWKLLHFQLVLINSINKTESAVFLHCRFSLFWRIGLSRFFCGHLLGKGWPLGSLLCGVFFFFFFFFCGRVPWLYQYWPGGFMLFVVLCPGTPEGSTGSGSGFKASQKTGQRLKVSSDRLGEAGNRTCDPWFTRHRFIPYSTAASQCGVFSCFCHFPMWCPGLGGVLYCIDSWSLPPLLLYMYSTMAKPERQNVTHVKGRLLHQAMILYNNVLFQNGNFS